MGYMIGITAACLGALSLGFMIIFDRLMMGDCYKNKPDQAWFVSSLAGSIFGMIATLIVWVLYTTFTDSSISDILSAMFELTSAQVIAIIAAGVVNIQVMQHYFRLFIPTEKGAEVNETAIAMWLASAPIFIFITLIILKLLGLNSGIFIGLGDAEMTIWFGLAVVLTVVTMIRFETYGTSLGNLFKRYGEVVKMLAMIVLYTILLSGVLRDQEMTVEMALAIQPFFWLGFSAGMRTMIRKQNRVDFIENWNRMKQFIVPIFMVEVIGMSVYFFEFFALRDVDATLVNLIIGAHIVPVFILIYALSRLRKRMIAAGETKKQLFWLPLEVDTLPNEEVSVGKIVWFTAVLITLMMTIAITQQ
jgi:hypothetical protein